MVARARGWLRTLGGMNIRLAPHLVAGWLFVLAALTFAPFWYLTLFDDIPSNFTMWGWIKDQLGYFFSSANPYFWIFFWLAAIPMLCVLMSLAYLSNMARAKSIRIALFGAGVLLAIATFALTNQGFAVFVAVPSIWGYRAIHAT